MARRDETSVETTPEHPPRERNPPRDPPRTDTARAKIPPMLGRYRVLFELARGGMGTVYVGRLVGAHGFDRLVAIKRLTEVDASDQDRAAFLTEARLTAKILHPNVVQTFELGEHDGAPFLVMQWIEGVSLARLLGRLDQRSERLDPRLAAWILLQAATGLHAAHELTSEGGRQSLVHRDVSPENLLLSYAGRVHVADFGIAKFGDGDRATSKGVLKGKFSYMSPEHVNGEPLDRRSDVFALGIVLWESIVGRRLFAGASAADTIRRVLNEPVPNLTELRSDAPAELDAIARRALERNALDRYTTAGEMATALRAFLKTGPGIDEHDLAALLERTFDADRVAMKARIDDAIGSSLPPPREVEEASPPIENRTEGSVTSPVGVPSGADRRGLIVGGVFAIAGVVLAIFLWRARTGTDTASVTRPTASPKPIASTIDAPIESASAPVEVASAAVPEPSSKSKVIAPQPKKTAAPVSAPPKASAPEATSATPNVKGVPFPSLGN